jgi:hypothetical protein
MVLLTVYLWVTASHGRVAMTLKCIQNERLKGLSHEIDFNNVDEN